MKRLKKQQLFKLVFTICFVVILTSFSLAQKAFEGRIVYDVEYIDFPDGMEGVELSLPQQMTMMVNGQNARIIQQSAIAGELLQIHRAGVDSIFQVFHFMGSHVLMTEPINRNAPKFRVVEKENVKSILGVEVHELHLQSSDGNHFAVWVDKKHQNPIGAELFGVKYLPLEYTVVKNGITMKLTARQIKPEPMDQTYFMLPENIVRISGSDLLKIMN